MRPFDELVREAAAVSVDGWDFSWLDGRATEERPPWGYGQLLAQRWASVTAALDLQTGGGEVLAGLSSYPPVAAATEGWPPNIALATTLLHPLGVVVVAHDGAAPLPFAADSFDLVTSRHPVAANWPEVARVVRPRGTYLAQHVGPESMFSLIEEFSGRLPDESYRGRHPEDACAAAETAGLEVVDVRTARLRVEYFDIGAIVYVLRKVIWWVPGFTVETYDEPLRRLDEHMRRTGPFVAHSSRFLIEARAR